ncbi:hypothetical protein ONZ45_g9514 [Pleurotus djamor]|nr:hypothetical protein ONZ45_g9514 [Pleurotus djamor]
MVLLYIDGQVSAEALCLCQTVGWKTISVSRIPPPRGRGVQKRYEDQYTKLNLWGLDQHGFESVVYLDADTLVHRNFDELFDLPFNLAVVPDVWVPGDHRGFDIAFNAGVLVLKPSSNILEQMKAAIGEARYPSAEAEQAFLNKYYGAKAARLPYIYNANLAIKRRSPVLWDELKSELSIVHYTLFKPFSGIPFPRHGRIDVSTINDPDEWREEVGWWRTALKNMMKNTDLSACSRSGVVLFAVLFILLRSTVHPIYRPLDDYQRINDFPVVNLSEQASDAHHRAVATTLYTDDYAVSAAVLGSSILAVNTTARMVLLFIDGQISTEALCLCQTVGWETIPMPRIPPPHGDQSVRKQFVDQYTKLNLWGLDQYGLNSVVYLDADTVVRRNFDELFDLPFNFAAVPDVYGPGDTRGFDITFNAGVLALKPSSTILEHMKGTIGTARYPPTQAEQAFLNLYFGAKAARLPYIYNANLAIKHRNPVLWDELKSESSIVHYTMFKPFLGVPFPSHGNGDASTINDSDEWREEVDWWRAAFSDMMKHTDFSACGR